jgi:formylmethanofuran dehydrogenase subunit E
MSDHRPKDLQRCIDFHGHLCPGLVIGYLAAREALGRLDATRSADEELVALVENDSCAVDAIQVMTGCTFGKGNLRFEDYGKMVFRIAVRGTGHGVRLSYRHPSPPGVEEMDRDQARDRQIQYMLAEPIETLFDVREQSMPSLEAARIHESVTCESCGEKVMATRIRKVEVRALCVPCANRERLTRHAPTKPSQKGRCCSEFEAFWQ